MATVSMRMGPGGETLQAAHRCALSVLERPCDVLVVAAHPDDESVGLAATLGRLARGGWRVRVLHVTDGAPRDPALRPFLRHRTAREAAAFRRAEAEEALLPEGVELLPCLGFVDQEAACDLPALACALAPVIASADVVVTHPYEGGHPDHDATAFAVHAVSQVPIAEMTSYHRGLGGGLEAGVFLGSGAAECDAAWAGHLDSEDSHRRERMFAAYASQREVLARLRITREPVRCAPAYDFTKPPHEGRLWYEDLGFGWTATRFLEHVRAATWRFAPPEPRPVAASPLSGPRTIRR